MCDEELLKKIFIVLFALFLIKYLFFNQQTEDFTQDNFVATFESARNMMYDLNLPYAIMYGTALGAYRNGDFIPHDDDVDIMVLHNDIANMGHKTIKEQRDHFNNIAKKYNLVPKYNNSAPFLYIDRSRNLYMPIMYQYEHKQTKMGVDIYIFYEYNNYAWNFCDGGEYDLKGYKFPKNNNFFKTKINKFDVISCPMEFLNIKYGPSIDTPVKKDDPNYYQQEREYFGYFLDEWLLPFE
jgi:phosphorylcholine metabolism protein LicD